MIFVLKIILGSETRFYNGKPMAHVFSSPNYLGAKKYQTLGKAKLIETKLKSFGLNVSIEEIKGVTK